MGTSRPETECRQHYCRVLKRNTAVGKVWMSDGKMGRWSSDEVQRLYEAHKKFTSWVDIARHVGTRDKSQCQSKWKQLEAPKKGAREWSQKEHTYFVRLFDRMPYQWRNIAAVGLNEVCNK